MSNFDFNIGAELGHIRGPKPEAPAMKPVVEEQPVIITEVVKQDKGEGFKVDQEHPGVVPASSANSAQSDTVDWKAFKTLTGMFEHVGGIRPVHLHPTIVKSQVSGIPAPLLTAVQQKLKDKHLGATIDFPWGTYTITDQNKVFTAKTSVVRYLLFDAFKNEEGLHLQYAKQWLALQYPAFTPTFNPSIHMNAAADELDIYALLVVAESVTEYAVHQPSRDPDTVEQMTMLNMSMTRILDKMNIQDQKFQDFTARSHMLDTVLLLDRMGLLRGTIPKNIDDFIRLLEQNRDMIRTTGVVVDHHNKAEEERQKTLLRDERLRNR